MAKPRASLAEARAGRARAGGPASRDARGQAGQVLVIFALSITVLFAAAGLAFDVGRFYAERRFLQNAADAAALAAANSLIQGRTQAEAETIARAVLASNFAHDPNGVTPSLPPATPVYQSGHAADPLYLINGILFSGNEVRVAVLNPINYSFGRVVGLTSSTIGGQARAQSVANMLPIAVRQFVNSPGPASSTPIPCDNNQNEFMDFFATADTACNGTETNSSTRQPPVPGTAFNTLDPDANGSEHGPVVAILGQGAQPGNGADFRGFIALDIRNFSSASSQLYYDNVTSGTNSNTLKGLEAGWILTDGYQGPKFPPITSPPDPNDQVAIMNGNSTGAAIDAMIARYKPGQEIMVCVYAGNVMSIPDFTLTPPSSVALPTSGTTALAAAMKVSRNQAFSGLVTLQTIADTLDPANPMVLGTLVPGADPVTNDVFAYTPNGVNPALGGGTSVDMTNATTSAATPGIYALWIRGQAGAPYLTTKYEPFALKIGTVTRDFTMTSDASTLDANTAGSSVTFNLTLQNAPDKNTAFGGPVTLSVDPSTDPGVGAITFGSTTVTPTKPGASTTLTINTGTLASGSHKFTVRATGMNGDSTSRKVTHVMTLTVRVTPSSGGSQEYVDLTGFAVMRIASMDANTINAYAITPVITNPDDYRLRRGQVAKLVPWS